MGCGGSKPGDAEGAAPSAKAANKNALNFSGQDLADLPAVASKTESIDCSNNKLTSLPPTLAELQSLTELDANENQLTTLPKELVNCAALEKLLVYKSKIKDLPEAFPPALKELNLFNNQLRKLPPSIGQLAHLEEVNFGGNKLMMTKDEMFISWANVRVLNMFENNLVRMGSLAPLVALEELRLNGNNLEEMPALAASHPSLSIIEFHKNRVTTIPDNYFESTPALTRLQLWGNQLTGLPSSICKCVELLGIQVQTNKIPSLPDGAWPEKLETLFLHDNPITSLPSGLSACKAMRRCNVEGLQLDAASDAVSTSLRETCQKTSGGIFWAKIGDQIKAD